jgi:hypothetical protein
MGKMLVGNTGHDLLTKRYYILWQGADRGVGFKGSDFGKNFGKKFREKGGRIFWKKFWKNF